VSVIGSAWPGYGVTLIPIEAEAETERILNFMKLYNSNMINGFVPRATDTFRIVENATF
jgi:hypothetical protein